MIKFVYGCLPAFVIYNDRLVQKKFGGNTWLMFIVMREKYRGHNAGLLEHELTHVKQGYRTLFTCWIWYWLSKKYRLKMEVEAYRAQVAYYRSIGVERSYTQLAESLATKYNLDISREDAIELLRDK